MSGWTCKVCNRTHPKGWACPRYINMLELEIEVLKKRRREHVIQGVTLALDEVRRWEGSIAVNLRAIITDIKAGKFDKERK